MSAMLKQLDSFGTSADGCGWGKGEQERAGPARSCSVQAAEKTGRGNAGLSLAPASLVARRERDIEPRYLTVKAKCIPAA